MKTLRDKFENDDTKVIIAGRVGPRGDGYVVEDKTRMNVEQAEEYHQEQIQWFVDAGVDMIAFITLNYCEEGIGIVQACQKRNIPVCFSHHHAMPCHAMPCHAMPCHVYLHREMQVIALLMDPSLCDHYYHL
jgi:S-methylmethionine-dependent homocysteine/selenocysteine methylase